MNIILCIVDTLRYDYIHAHGANPWIRTPNFDHLAAQSVIFDYTFAASYPTIPHRTDVMTGKYAWKGQGPFHPWMPLRFDVPTLPRLLAQHGYATQLIHDTPHLVNGGHAFDWPFAAWSFVRGAEVDRPWIDDAVLSPLSNWKRDSLFDYMGDAEPTGAIKRLLLTYSRANRKRRAHEDWSAAKLFIKGAEFLQDNVEKDNFFLWLDCFDPHEPWDSPVDFVRLYDNTPGFDGSIDPRAFYPAARNPKDGIFPLGVRERQQALYAAKVSWVDHWFGLFMVTLEKTGLADRSVLLVTADHGTNLGERGGFGKTGVVNEQEAHVPFLLRVPGMAPGRNEKIIQPQDIFATILSLAGAKPPACTDGFDVTAMGETKRSIALGGLSTDNWQDNPQRIVFSVFNRDWYLNIAADPAACRLYRYGSVDDVASSHVDVVHSLREKAWAELSQRDTHPGLIQWLSSGGKSPFSAEWNKWSGPPEWRRYWERVYEE